MKKQFLFAMAAVAMLASCSNDDVVSNNGIDGDKGRIEVKLGQPNIISSRSSISTTIGWKSNQQIGIFALNRKATDWSVITDPNDRLIYNEATKVDAAGTDLSWVSTTKHFYYPYDRKYEYSFYGYHPVQAANKVVAATNQVTCDFTLDGTQDILWGKAILPTATAGYNYQYFVQYPAAVPAIAFKHLLTRFQFYIVAGATGGSTTESAKMSVTKIEILNIQTAAKLVIANLADSDVDVDRPLTLSGAKDQTLILTSGTAGAAATATTATAGEGTLMGESIMLPAGATSYDVRISFQGDGGKNPTVITAKLKRTNDAPFLAGQSHKVKITLTEPKEVSLKASLTEWTDGETLNPVQ